MTLMGTGTSHGIPVISCSCPVCSSPDPKDKRLRCSALIENDGNTCCDVDEIPYKSTSIVIDTGPEFRIQCLKFNVKRLDGVLMTHAHADHCFGLDDLRVFSFRKLCTPQENLGEGIKETKGEGLPVYANKETIKIIKSTFPYIFKKLIPGGGIPKLVLKAAEKYSKEKEIEIGSVRVLPVFLEHGQVKDTGWIIKDAENPGKSIVYLTDCSYISDEAVERIKNNGGQIIHLVIDALRKNPHPTHLSFDQAMEYAQRIGACHTWFTHICHDRSHEQIQSYIDEKLKEMPALLKTVQNGGSVSPAYDGLILEI